MKKILVAFIALLAAAVLMLPHFTRAAAPPAAKIFRLYRTATPTPTWPLIVDLSVSPSSGVSPLSVLLTAKETSANTGEFNFYFWCDNDSSSTGTDGSDQRYENTTSKTQTYTCLYNAAGTYHPKVVITKSGLDSVESRKIVTVTADIVSPTPRGGEIIFEKDGKAIRVRGSLVANQIDFNPREKNSQRYAAMIYSDSKVLYSALPGFETLVNVMIK